MPKKSKEFNQYPNTELGRPIRDFKDVSSLIFVVVDHFLKKGTENDPMRS